MYNTNEKHRERMYARLLEFPDSLRDYEILETLLFFAIPRKDTKPIAKELLNTFGSLQNVLDADPKLLTSVNGVGERTASFIKLQRILQNKIVVHDAKPIKFSPALMKQKLIAEFRSETTEIMRIFFLNKQSHLIGESVFQSQVLDEVKLNLNQIAKAVIATSPDRVIIAHNHLSGDVSPTTTDDKTTKILFDLFKLHGALLVDHFIVSGNQIYSYYQNDRQ